MYKSTTKMWQPTLPALFKITVLGSALIALGVMTGCSSTPSTQKVANTQMPKGSGYLDADSLDSLEGLLSATDMRAVEGDRLLILKHGDVWKRMRVGFKMDTEVWNPRIDAQRSWFTSRQPYIDRLSARASRYLYHTVKEAERRGIPTELALLPVIESSYDPAATSSAAAAGLWQFIPSTGKIYGLRQTSLYDGRRDVVESTRAAYEFLGGLYNQFGSWELALAAYNAGPGRIQQAINRNKAAGLPTDYWSLKLPQETMNYVPRFIAVAQIIKNPDAYGVSLPPIANRPHFREIVVGSVSLNDVAAVTGLSRAELYALNPGYRGDYIDSDSPMKIIIPADISPAIDTKLRKLNPTSSALLAQNIPSSSNTSYYGTSSVNSTTPATKTSSGVTVSTSRQPVTSTPVTKTTTNNSANISASAVSKNNNEQTPFTTTKRGATPQGSSALASFAANTDIPSAPRIPVAVVQATNVKPISVEPPLSEAEKKQILLAVEVEGTKQTIAQVLQPVASKAEQEQVVAEIQKIAPQGTEIVDPYDGKIKLTAIQTSLSVAEQQGKELTKGFAYPKSLTENTSSTSEEAKRNHGKNVIQTDSEVVVIPPKGKRTLYTVVSGDTLAIIAAKNGVNWRDIANWNQIDPTGTLFAGATLYLYDVKPQAQADTSNKEKSKPETYIVQANDSLTGVASQFGLTVKQLADFNDLSTTSNLIVGQKLSLKEDNSNTKQKNNSEKKNDQQEKKISTKTYVVKRGEYLKLIADRYDLSLQELADLTPNLTVTSSLIVGQKIKVPSEAKLVDNSVIAPKKETKSEPAIKLENYTVQRGDTLYSIALNSKISMSELATLNNLATNSNLQAGQKLKVPAKEDTSPKTPVSYTVQAGDTLSGVAVKYNLNMDDITSLNNITHNANLRVGQKLKLVADEVKTSTKNGTGTDKKSKNEKEVLVKESMKNGNRNTEKYVVKTGESLHVIAGRAGMPVAELASLNDLSPKAGLRVGQSILIPKTTTTYKVKRGDTLIGLASRYGMETSALAELNEIQPNVQLKIGETIKVPNL